MAEYNTIRVGELPPAPWGMTNLLPKEVAGNLTRGTVQQLADLISDYIGTASSLAFNPTTILDGGTLPDTDSPEWVLVGKGTFYNVNGGATITTTEELNALTSNGTVWALSVEIPINVELAGIVQSVRSGYTTTAPSEDAVFNAIAQSIPEGTEMLVNKQDSLVPDPSGVKYITVNAVVNAINSIKQSGDKLNSYSLVTDNKVYSAFPTIAKVGSNLLTVYRKAPNHYTAGIISGRISTDNGSSWGNEFTVLSESSWNLSATSLKLLANGNVMLIFSRDNGLTPIGNSDVRSVMLNSSGTVISSPVILGGFSSNYSAFGQMIQLTNGNILVPVYGIDSGAVKVKVIQSVNNGVSWAVLATLASSATTDFALSIDETSLLLLPNGNIVASLRNEVTDKIAFSKSTDNGVTWSAVTDKFDGESAASLGYTPDNKIIVSYRVKTTSETAFRYSSDEGDSFSSEITLAKENPQSFNYLYSGFVNVGNQMGYVYSLETSDDNACILFRYIYENQPFGDIISTKSLGLTNYADLDIMNGDLKFSPRNLNNILTNADNTYAGSLLIQAGKGSASFGGGYSLFGASHPAKAGWTQANISNTTGAKFSINNGGTGAGADVFTVDRSGNAQIMTILSYASKIQGDVDGTWNINYNNSTTGGLDFYGGTNSLKASILNNGTIKSSTLAGTGTRQVVADASGNLSAGSVQPKKYVAFMSQTGTSAPVVTVLENTIGSIAWTRPSTGYGLGTLSGAFTLNKTWVSATNANGGSASSGFKTATASTVDFRNYISGVLGDGYEAYIEIRVYP